MGCDCQRRGTAMVVRRGGAAVLMVSFSVEERREAKGG